MSTFSEWLNRKIERRKVELKELAAYTGLSSRQLTRVRLGEYLPPSEVVVKIAEYFKVDANLLLAIAGLPSLVSFDEEEEIEDPALRELITPENINQLSLPIQRGIIAIIETELELLMEQSQAAETEN
jgi:transcriptional regulator with XRE-family HTH domain